ncbi:MAG: hypothetical protein IAF58_09010 [Leptolyngbya sp.]|nr:hypothetical protein [Candidatus Melainabacteria bacterium]
MKRTLSIAFFVLMATSGLLNVDAMAQTENAPGNGTISMTLYPVVRELDGNQYLITPSGKKVTVPGLVIAPNATQVPVYRDPANHFWYTAMNGQQIAVTPQQLEAVQSQINAQSGGGGMPPQTMAPAQSFYTSTPAYAGGFNGVPYGTPMNIESPGKFSYSSPDGSKQFVTPTPQASAQFSQWQQQVPYGQIPPYSPNQSAPNAQSSSQNQTSAQKQGGQSRMDLRRDNRAQRLENRSQAQSKDATADQAAANSKMQAGQTLGTGFDARRSARETRRAKREERRADFLKDN